MLVARPDVFGGMDEGGGGVWASNSARLNAGLAILSTPMGSPAGVRSEEVGILLATQCSPVAESPKWAAAICAACSSVIAGTGSSAASKSNVVIASS